MAGRINRRGWLRQDRDDIRYWTPVGNSSAGEIREFQFGEAFLEPALVRPTVAVDERDRLTTRSAYPRVAGRSRAALDDRNNAAARSDEPAEEEPATNRAQSKEIMELLKESAAAAREIRDAGPSAYALLEIAGVTIHAGDRETAQSLVGEAIQLFPKVKSTANLEKVSVAERAAALQVRLGDLDGALRTVELLNDEEERDSVRLEIISGLLSPKEYEQALDLCGQFGDEEFLPIAPASVLLFPRGRSRTRSQGRPPLLWVNGR